MSQATTTTDHDEIRRWAEERGGRPAVVRTARGRGGILRFDFGEADAKLEEISWEEFFRVFDDNKLAFLHQDTIGAGATSRFFKFVGQREPKKAGATSTARRAPTGAKAGAGARKAARGAVAARSTTRAAKAGASKAAKGAAKGAAQGASKGASAKAGAKAAGNAGAAKAAGTKSRAATSSSGLKGATRSTGSAGAKKPSRRASKKRST
jgi:hypothetical protein